MVISRVKLTNERLGSELCTLKDNKDKKAKNPKKSLIKTMQTRQQGRKLVFVNIPKKRNFSLYFF